MRILRSCIFRSYISISIHVLYRLVEYKICSTAHVYKTKAIVFIKGLQICESVSRNCDISLYLKVQDHKKVMPPITLGEACMSYHQKSNFHTCS